MNINYKTEVALGHLITIFALAVGGLGAYHLFVAETQTGIATLEISVEANADAIAEIRSTLKTLPTQDQLNALQEDTKEIRSDLGWLIKREVEKSGN